MAVTAKILEYLLASGGDVDQAIHVAQAMESGDDAWRMFQLVAQMEDEDFDPPAIGAAIVQCADLIKSLWAVPAPRGPSVPDPYKERLGLSKGKWRRLREIVFDRDGRECSYCGATEDLSVDHVVPLSRGGTNDPENLTPACKPCNSSKRDKLVEEWIGQ